MHTRAWLLIAVTLSFGASCTQSEADACGAGTVYRDGDCHPAPVSSSGSSSMAGAPADAGASTGAGGESGAANQSPDPNFGAACTESQDCAGSTNYCVPMSPFDSAYCSASGCDRDPNVCPAGWTCFDISQFVPGAPSACTRPAP